MMVMKGEASQSQPMLQQESALAASSADSLPLPPARASRELSLSPAGLPELPAGSTSVPPPTPPQQEQQRISTPAKFVAPKRSLVEEPSLVLKDVNGIPLLPPKLATQELSFAPGDVDSIPLPPLKQKESSLTFADLNTLLLPNSPSLQRQEPTFAPSAVSSLPLPPSDQQSGDLRRQEPTFAPSQVDFIPLPPPPASIAEQRERQRTKSAAATASPPEGDGIQQRSQDDMHPTRSQAPARALFSAATAPEQQEWAGAHSTQLAVLGCREAQTTLKRTL